MILQGRLGSIGTLCRKVIPFIKSSDEEGPRRVKVLKTPPGYNIITLIIIGAI